MYKEWFGLSHRPFTQEIKPVDFFKSESLKQFQQRMEFLQKHGGIGVVWGTSGSGKTTALRWLREQINPTRFAFYYIPDPPKSVNEFYRQLANSLNLQPTFRRSQLYIQIQDAIRELTTEKKRTPVIVLDELQLYPNTVLESLYLLLNFEMDSKIEALLILSGQPEFRKRLQLSVYEALVQRITVQCQMPGLLESEIQSYIEHRLNLAGCQQPLFETDAMTFIYQVTKGVLRKIDKLAVASLELAALEKKKSVPVEIIQEAIKQFIWG